MTAETLPATTDEQNELRFIAELEKSGGSELMPVADLRKLRLLSISLARSDLVPAGMKGKPENLMLAMLHAHGLGLDPFRALQNMYVVNGRVSIFGDLFMALVTSFDEYGGHEERFEGEYGKDNYTAICTAKRRDIDTTFAGRFSVADAKRAKLWGKTGVWSSYPNDMLMWKARARAFRQGFAHRLCGVTVYEDVAEVEEVRSAINITPGRKTLSELETQRAAVIPQKQDEDAPPPPEPKEARPWEDGITPDPEDDAEAATDTPEQTLLADEG